MFSRVDEFESLKQFFMQLMIYLILPQGQKKKKKKGIVFSIKEPHLFVKLFAVFEASFSECHRRTKLANFQNPEMQIWKCL